MTKKANTLVDPIDLRVTGTEGVAFDYRTTPFDVWRAEKLTGRDASDGLLTSYGGYAALAWSCALRAGHAFRAKQQTDQQSFEAWLADVAAVELLSDDEEGSDAVPLEETSSSA